MAEAILKDKHLIVPASAFLNGEYGLKDMFFGVPVQLGRGGLEKVIEYKLDPDEKAALEKSAAAVKESIGVMETLVKF
jgi:malate dehydrogenase